MKRRLFYLALIIISLIVMFTACENDNDNNGNISAINAENVINADNSIAIVKASIERDDYARGKIDYEAASAEYKNGGFKLNLSDTVPDKCLEKVLWHSSAIEVSDNNAKINFLTIRAYNKERRVIGDFMLRIEGKKDIYHASYIYADRNFTVNGNDTLDNLAFDCTFEKGWNILYSTKGKVTTQKPSKVKLNWYFNKYEELKY